MNNTVLIVEDEDSIRKFVKLVLTKKGFNVIEAESGEKGLEKVNSESPAVVLLDIMLPGIDGFKTCELIRRDYPNVGIIMLTARGQDIDKIKGLEFGADDYVVKPFNPLELSARINSLLRRMTSHEPHDSNIIKSGPFKIDIACKLAYKNDIELNLTPKEFLLMKIFLQNQNKALSRNHLLDLAWGYNFVGDPKIVDVNVRRLRNKLEDNPSSPNYIETVWGMGYRWKEN